MTRHCRGRVDDPDTLTGDFTDSIHEKRVVGASEHYHIRPGVEQGADALFHCGLGFRPFRNPALDQLHEPASHMFHHLHPFGEHLPAGPVFRAVECAGCGEHPYYARPCHFRGRLDGRLHTYEFHMVAAPS